MTMPFAVLSDATDHLWHYVKRGHDVPYEIAAALHDEIADLDGIVSAMEAQLVALSRLAGTPVEFAEVPTVAERMAKRRAIQTDGNVVRPVFGRSPNRPATPVHVQMSGCFSVEIKGSAS